MNSKMKQRHSVDILFLLVIFLVFLFSAVSLLVLAINFYRSTSVRSEENDSARVAVAYVREVIHQNDVADEISICEFDGVQALAARQEGDYVLYLYYNDGELRELYTKEGAQVTAEDGQRIMELQAFDIKEITPGVFAVECEDLLGNREQIIISRKSSRGGADDETT